MITLSILFSSKYTTLMQWLFVSATYSRWLSRLMQRPPGSFNCKKYTQLQWHNHNLLHLICTERNLSSSVKKFLLHIMWASVIMVFTFYISHLVPLKQSFLTLTQKHQSRDSSAGIVTRLWAGWLRLHGLIAGTGDFSSLLESRYSLRLIRPSIQWIMEAHSSGVKWSRHEAEQSASPTVEVRMNAAILPHPHMHSWNAQGLYLLQIVYI